MSNVLSKFAYLFPESGKSPNLIVVRPEFSGSFTRGKFDSQVFVTPTMKRKKECSGTAVVGKLDPTPAWTCSRG